MEKVRNISQNEIMYMDMQELLSPFIIQYIFKYEKPVDVSILDEAVKKAQNKFKDCFVKAVGNCWVENPAPVKTVEMTVDVDDILTIDLFMQKTDFRIKFNFAKRTAIKNRNEYYLVFRLSHSVFDGKGAFLLIDNIFSYINDESITECNNSENDEDFIKGLHYKNETIDVSNEYHLKGNVSESSKVRFKVFEFNKYHQAIISKLAICFSSVFKENSVKYMIPTDIRKYRPDEKIVSNLVLPTFIDAGKNDKWEDVNISLILKMNESSELNKKSVKHFCYRYIPENARKFLIRKFLDYKIAQKSFMGGAIISHLGRLDFEKYKIKDNTPLSFCSLPVQQPLIPFSVVISEFDNKTTIALSYYENQLEKTYLDEMFETIDKCFKSYVDYEEFNNTEKEIDNNFVNKIFKSAEQNPDEICIYEGDKSYTYLELLNRSAKIAGFLKDNEVICQDKIVINLKRSFDYIASVLAVFRLGAAFIPVDKKENEFRLNQIKNSANPKFIINEEALDNIKENTEIYNEVYDYKADDKVYNIYTSGTTGEPKSVEISLENFSNYIEWAKETYKVEKKCIMPLFTSLSVDLTMTSVFLPLISKGAIKIFSDEFCSLILDKIYEDDEINIVKCTPTHLSLLGEGKFKAKKWLIVGGENFSNSIYMNVKNYNENIVNEYGPTETTVGSIYFICDSKTEYPNNIPIGKPIFNTKIYLADKKGELIKEENITGEIVISGKGVTVCEKKENYKTFNNERCYFTGDLGYFEDSVLHCIGREDFQIKINGQRLDLSEINSRLAEIDGITAVESLYFNSHIYSFVVTKNNYTQEELINILESKLPKIAVSKIIYFLESLPLLINGKTDRNNLFEIIKKDNVENNTNNELKLLIQEVVDDEQLDLSKDNLHKMGVDSLGMLQVGQKINEKYIKSENKEAFFKEYISKIAIMEIKIIEELIDKYGK